MSVLACGFGLLYAIYRGYYALGGTAGMIGTVRSQPQWRHINLAAAVILLVAASLPVCALPLWRLRPVRPVLLALCWVIAVGCVAHGLVDDTQRVLSLAGVLKIHYPASLWRTLNRHEADIQDLGINETWFLAEGLTWGLLGSIGLGQSAARRWWAGTAITAIAVLTAIGLLTALGVIPRFISN